MQYNARSRRSPRAPWEVQDYAIRQNPRRPFWKRLPAPIKCNKNNNEQVLQASLDIPYYVLLRLLDALENVVTIKLHLTISILSAGRLWLILRSENVFYQ